MRIIISILILVSVSISWSCSSRTSKLESDINEFLLRNIDNPDFELKLDTISSFEWDEIIIAGPYFDSDYFTINSNAEYDLKKLPSFIKHHDRYVLIGFLKDKTVVNHVTIERWLVTDSIFESSMRDVAILKRNESNFRFIK